MDKEEVLRTLEKLANDYLVYPDETKALDYAIRKLKKPSIIDVLDKIRDELVDTGACEQEVNGMTEFLKGITYCLRVIDEYKAESEK